MLYLEGYSFDPPKAKEAFYEAAMIARGAGTTVALTLSDPFCVERHRQAFLDFIKSGVDLLFANHRGIDVAVSDRKSGGSLHAHPCRTAS